MTDIAGKNVLITGAASGIGCALARAMGARGADLILWDVAHPELKAVTEELRMGGRNVFAYCCDVSSREAVAATATRVLEECGPVDILINNAGIVSGKPILEASDDETRRTFDVNVLSLFRLVRAFLPTMRDRQSGHIVTIASAGGLVGAPRLTDYSASKFAAVGFDESLRLELKAQGLAVRTTVVCPYYVDTGMFRGVKTRFPRLLPILETDRVAERIVRAIERDRPRLILPRFVYAALILRFLPVRWFDALIEFFGVARSMDEFTGRSS